MKLDTQSQNPTQETLRQRRSALVAESMRCTQEEAEAEIVTVDLRQRFARAVLADETSNPDLLAGDDGRQF